jgi:hypothetical protein
MTLLSIVKDVAVRCGWSAVPTSAISNASSDALNIAQVIAFAQDAGRDAMERQQWTGLDVAATLVGDGTTTLFTLPTDWRQFNPGDESQNGPLVSSKYPLMPLSGPVNAEDLNILKALPASTVRPLWRIIGNSLELWPALSPGETVTFNYFSKYWILDITGLIRRARWAVDSDTSVIDEDLIMKGAVWRWLASKGLDYAEAFRASEMALSRDAAQQMTGRMVSTSSRDMPYSDQAGFFGTITDLTTH